jgi:hypothetical protein
MKLIISVGNIQRRDLKGSIRCDPVVVRTVMRAREIDDPVLVIFKAIEATGNDGRFKRAIFMMVRILDGRLRTGSKKKRSPEKPGEHEKLYH